MRPQTTLAIQGFGNAETHGKQGSVPSAGAHRSRAFAAGHLFLLIALFVASPAYAQTEVPNNWPLIPSGLVSGDQFRLMLVVDATRDATATSIATYDSFVRSAISQNGHASLRDYSNGFNVLGSTSTVDARDHTGTTYTATNTGVPIYWLNGSKIADDYEDFYDGSWAGKGSPRYEDGSAVNPGGQFRIWTGSNNDGTTYFQNPNNPNTSRGLGGDGNNGQTRTARPTANLNTLNSGQRDASEELPLFALSGVFEVGSASTAAVSTIQITSTNGGDGEYVVGDELEFTVTFSEAVSVTGAPRLNFRTNDTGGSSPETRQATYDSGNSTSTELAFNYTVTSGDFDEDGIELPTGPIDLNGGTIVSQGSSSGADLAFAAIPDQGAHKIHIEPGSPRVEVISDPASASAGYVTGETIRIAVTWDKKVRAVTNPVGTSSDPNHLPGGASQVTLRFDSDDNGLAAYSQAGSDYTLHFDYVVQPGDWDDGGLTTDDYLARNGGSITRKEVADGVARFVRAAETGLALNVQAGHKVNVNRPRFSSLVVASSPATGDTYQAGETIKAELTFDQAMTVDATGGTPSVKMELQSTSDGAAGIRELDYASGSGTTKLVFEYTLQAGDSDDNGITIPAKALKLNGGTIRDADGTDLHLADGVPSAASDFSGHKAGSGTVVAVTVSFDAATYTASEEGADATVTVNLSADPEREVVIPIVAEAANGGRASDFTLTSQTVTIASGSTSGTFRVRATDDQIDDDGETVELSFGGLPNGVTAGAQATASVSITDEDTRGVIYSSQSVRVPEGTVTTADVFTLKLATQPSNDVRVTFDEDPDQQLDIPSRLNFTPSNWGTPQPVSVVWAAAVGPDETIVITLTPEFEGSDYRNLVTPATVTLTIFDRSRPSLESATVDGTSLVLTWNQDLDDTSVPAQDAFEVTVDGADVSVSSVSIDGAKVTLTLATAAVMGDEVEVSYTVPTTNPIQDEDENKARALTDRAVTNNSPDTTAPSLSSATIDADMLVLTYDEDLDTGSTPGNGAFEVTVDGADVSVSSVSIDGAEVALTLASEAGAGDAVTLSYTVPASNPIRDEAENEAGALTDQSVTNNTAQGSDALLSGIALEDNDGNAISLSPVFASGTKEYTATVAAGIGQVTIAGTASSSAASVAYTPSTDADGVKEGHQVNLSFGENTLEIEVTSGDGNSTETYEIELTREKPVVAITGMQVAEGDGSASLVVSLTPAVNEVVVVNYETRDYPTPGSPDHAYAGYDYTEASGSLTFAANETSKTIEVEILEDDLYEGGGEVDGETFWVYLALPAGAKNAELGVPGAVLIRDNDDPPMISIADASANEGDPVSFTVSLSEVSGLAVTASYATSVESGDGATSGTDFTSVTGATVTVPAGSTTATADVNTVEDTHYEADETFTVTLSAPPAGTHLNATLSSDPTATGTITNDDVLEQVTGVTPTVASAKLTINWTAVAGAGGYKVQWKSGTEDYSNSATPSRQATISSGATTSHELTSLTNGTTYTIRVAATHSAAADGAWSSEVSATPFETDTTAPTLTLATVNGASLVLTYDEDLDDNSTPAASDFSVSVAGSSVAVSNVSISGKEVALTLATGAEYDDTVSLSYTVPASNPIQDTAGNDAAALSGQAVTNNTSATVVALTLDVTSVAESAGATTVRVTGTLDGAPRAADTDVTVRVGASSDAATEGTDYATVNDLTLTIDAGETSGTAMFSLTPTDDDIDEADEALSVSGTTTGLTVNGTTATITDDDTRGVTVSAATLTVAEGSTGTYTVVLTSEPTADVTVTPSRASGSSDVTFSPESLSFTTDDWDTAQTVTVAAAHDADFDADEATVAHAVSGGDYGANSVTASDVEVTVTDDDIPPEIVAGGVEVSSFPRATYNTYGVDETIAVSVTFDTEVAVNTTGGTPYIKVGFKNSGANAVATEKHFSYASGSGNATLVFEYEVQAADRDNDGIRIGSNALVLNGGTIRDTDNLDAQLTHAAAGRQQAHHVDGREVVGPAELSFFLLRTADGGTVLPSSPDFDPETTAYTASVSYPTTLIRVVANPEDGGERIILPADARPSPPNIHEVALSVGTNEITITASRRGVDDRIYTVTVTRGKPTVTLTAVESSTTYRLEDLSFTVSRNQAIDEALDVNVAFEQDQDFLPASGLSHTVTIPANETSATLTLETGDFTGGATADGTLAAAIADSDGYNTGTPNSASVDFVVADPALTVRFDSVAYEFSEDDGTVSLDIVAETAPGVVLSNAFSLSVQTSGDDDSATSSDYNLTSGGVTFEAADFAESNGALMATGSIDLTLLDDSDTEGEESFWIELSATDFPPAATLVQGDGTDCPSGGCRSKVTIIDDESPPAQVTGVEVTPGAGELTVEWTSVAGATGYKVQWKSGTETFATAATDSREATVSSGSTTSHTITGLTDGTVYTVRVIATSSHSGDGQASAEVTGTPGLPTLTIADASATEGNAVEFTVTLSPAADAVVSVLYATSDGTATADGAHEDGADYTAPASDAALTITAGQTSGTISIATGNDTADEDDETFTVTLSDPSPNAVLGTDHAATGTIVDNDTDPAEVTGVAFENEPTSGEYALGDVIQVSVTFDTSVEVTGAPRVRLAMSGTAASASYAHYDATESTETVLAFRHTVTADDDDADAISVAANGLELNGGTINNKGTTAAAVLAHDAVQGGDIRTRWVESIAITSEPEVGSPAPTGIYGPGEVVEFTVTFGAAVTVDDSGGDPELVFSASDGARQEAAYANGSGTTSLVFEWTVPTDVPGEEGAIEIPANTTGGGTLLTSGGLVLNGATIEDANSRAVNIRHEGYATGSEVDTTPPEVASGAGGATVDGTTLVLTFERASGVADHLDESSVPAPQNFVIEAAGSAQQASAVEVDGATVTLTLGSEVGHAQEVTVTYSLPSTNRIRDLWGNNAGGLNQRVVRNDSPEPELSITDVTVAEDAGKATFTVTLDVASGEEVTVDYATSDGTAEADSDYDEANGTLTISAGATSETFDVTVNDDTVGEGDETFTVTLSSAVNATIITATATGTITDDETPTLTIADATATEGSAVVFTVTLSPAADDAVTVAYATSDGTATADATHEDGADYTAPASDAALTITAGQTSGTISIATGNDTADEDDETFTVTLSDPSSNAVLGTDKAATGTIVDNDTDPAEVTGVAFENAPSSGEYALGDVIEVSVTFDAAVEVTGAPRVRLAMSGTAASASYAHYHADGSTETVLAFRHTVTADDDDADAISVAANGLELNGGTINNKGTTAAAVLAHDVVQGGDIRTRWVESIAITSEPEVGELVPEGIYGPGEEVSFTATFSAVVTVDDSGGDPVLVFAASDGTRQEAAYASGSGTTALVFEWTVPSDVSGEEGAIEILANTTGGGTLLTNGGLVLNGASIEDAQGRAVNIRHGAYSTGSEVDTTPPVVASGADGATVDGTTLVLTFERASGVPDHLDENSVPAAADFVVTVAGSAQTVSTVEVDGATVTLTLQSPVGHAQTITVNYTPGTNPIRDLLGNEVVAFTGRAVRNDSPEPSLSIGDVTVAEDAGEATFTVTLDVVSGEEVTVAYATSDGTAEADSDYDEASGTLTIAAGATSNTFDVTVNDDSVGEGDETFTVTLSNAVNATIATATATGTIADDELPALTIADASATEGSAVEFTVTLSPAADAPVTVAYATSDGTATADAAHEDGADYTASASDAQLTIAAGQTSGTISIATGDDEEFEADETFTVTLSNPSSNAALGAVSAATGTIGNNDAASMEADLKSLGLQVSGRNVDLTPVFAAGTYSYEAEVANTVATVNVTAEPVHDGATVAISDDDDSTSPGEAALPLTFGENTFTVTVTAEDGNATQTYTVKVTRGLPVLSWEHGLLVLIENVGEVTLTATLTPASIDEVTVDYATQAAGATPGEDFIAASGTLTFAAGETEKTVKITILDDNLYEPGAASDVNVILTDPTGTAVVGSGLGNRSILKLTDNDDPPTATMENVTVDEDAGTMEFTLSLTHGVETDDLEYEVASGNVGGTATSGSDYESFISGDKALLAVPSRATSATFNVSILDDDIDEDDETITLQWKQLSLTQYVAEASQSIDVTGTITDDDTRGVMVSATTLTVPEGGTATYTVVLTSQPTDDVTVTPSLAAGSSSDVTFSPTSLTFGTTDWDQVQTVTVAAGHDDDVVADAATIKHAATGGDYASAPTGEVSVGVTDDDQASTAVALAVDVTSLDEDAGATTITVTGRLDGGTIATATDVTVSVGDSGDGATEGADYTTVADFTLTIAVGQTSGTATFTLTPTDDDIDEADETLSVTGTVTGLTVTGATATITDDDERGVTISTDSLTVPEGGSATYTVVLASQPTDDVTVAMSGTTDTDVTVSPTSLEFTADNWDQAQTVTVSAAEDDDAEHDTATLSHAVSGGDYGDNNVTGADLAVTVGDNETASTAVALTVNPTAVAEEATATTVTVTGTLDGAPRADVTTVTVLVGATDDAAAEGTDYATVADLTLTIPAGQTTSTADFTLTPTDDDIDEDDETLTVTGTTTAEGLTVTVTTVTLTDDDTRGVTISTDSLTVTEGGNATYTVVLASEPSDDVTIAITGTTDTDLTLSETTLTFTASNWETVQPVTVSAAEDDDAEHDTATLSHAVSGGDYGDNNVTAADLAVTVGDNETASTAVALTVNPTAVNEDASATTVTVTGTLDDAPRAAATTVTVLVGATDDAATEGTDYATVADFTLTIPAGQTSGTADFTLTPTDDDIDEDDETLSVTGTTTTEGLTVTVTTATITDDDERGVTISTDSLTVPEGGSATYTVVLASEPTADVTVAISGTTATDLTLSPTSLEFTADNWDQAQTVTVSAAEDDDAEHDTVTLSHAVSGGDYGDNNVTAADLAVTVGDNETASTAVALTMNPTAVAEEATATTVTVTGTLDGAPRTDVTTVTVLVGATDDAATEGTDYATVADFTLTIPAGQTSGTAMFTLTPTDDDIDEDDETLSVTGTTTTEGLTVTVTTATITDDDERGVTISTDSLTVPEGGSATYSVVLASEPTADVTVAISGTTATDLTLNETSLEFTTDNWDQAQPVTVSAAEDDDAEDDEATLSHAVSGADYGDNNVTAADLAVTVADNETASTAVALTVNPMSVAEDATATTVTVTGTLDGAPRTDVTTVTVTVEASTSDGTATAGSDYRAKTLSKTFAPGETSKIAVVSVLDDSQVEGSETMTLTLSNASGAELADGVATGTITDASSNSGDVDKGDVVEDDPLAVVDGLTPEEATQVLFGERSLSEAQLTALDRLGNQNGSYDLGDVLSWIERCRRDEADCGGTSTDSGPAGAVLIPAAAAGGRGISRRRKRRDPARHRRARRREGRAGYTLAVLLAAIMAWSCTDGSVGPVAPTATEPDPGFLSVELSAPAANRDNGVLLELKGPGIETLRAPGFELYASEAPDRHQIVVAGSLGSGSLMQFHVPDRNQLHLYRVRVLQVTGEDYGLRDPAEYRAVVIMN